MVSYSQLISKLTRVTHSAAVIPEIDGLRFLAILPVVLLHLSTNYVRENAEVFTEANLTSDSFFNLINKGSVGVHVFFAISGFILALPFAQHYISGGQRPALKAYYLRRLTRLEPPFIISMIIFFMAWVVIGKYSVLQLLNSLWASLLYVHYFVFGKWSLINPISWSLETEVQFYLLAPLLFMVFLIPKWNARLIVVTGFCVVLAVVIYSYRSQLIELHLTKSIIIYFAFFAIGILLADLYTRHKPFFARRSFMWDLAGLIGLVILYRYHHTSVWYAALLQSAGIAFIFTAAFKGNLLNWFFTRSAITVTGGMCYSIYLVHYGLLYGLSLFTAKLHIGDSFFANYLLQAVITLPVILIISALFYYLFEKPFMYRNWYKDFPGGYLSRLK